MVSMKDISVACGVSVATVSKALNDHKDIGARTKERIRQTAKEMGYFPNSAAQALKTNRTYNIGVLFVDEAMSGLTHDFFSYVLDSFKRTAEEHGYDITFINCSKNGKNRMSYLEHTKHRGFDGVVIACIDFGDPEVIELIQSDVPVVTIDHLFNNRIAVMSDNVNGMRQLFTFIYEKGHRKIAYIHGEDSAVTQSRVSSFYKTSKELGVEIPDEYVRQAAYRNTKEAYDRTVELLDLPDPPTCILYPDDFASFGGINAIQERGLRIPDDISVAGYDGIRVARHIEPKLTTLKQDTERIGYEAAEHLISLIEEPRSTLVQVIMIGGEVLEGHTVRDLNMH
ncbi:MAG: LacI family transcriptional regulator [Lachnospiraceae bacterium]|nr:LacI family transcriptional regulator [Lachnospiraceae bacterium]MDD7177405.1 LacI family DNA-binding transcriptional regulator [bacterium]MDY5516633.1 LacI family DNA-binding transcriptional regulator [Lachnospiraceae bacterium]